MIDKMTKLSFILLSGEEGSLLKKIQEIGLVDITRSSKPVDRESHELYAQADLIYGVVNALDKVKIPSGTPAVPFREDLVNFTGDMISKYVSTSSSLSSLKEELEDVLQWGVIRSEDLRKLKDLGLKITFHQIKPKGYKIEWEQEYAIKLLSRDDKSVRFLVLGEDSLPGKTKGPQRGADEIRTDIADQEASLSETLSYLAYSKENKATLEQTGKEVLAALDYKLANLSAVPAAENTIVTLEGFCPTENADEICAVLDSQNVFYLREDACVQDNPPIKFKNNWFVRQFEVLTDMYGRPAYDGFDPTPFISVFFLLFFAFCMGDCGYGLILILIGLLLKKVDSFKDMSPLVVILGIGTTVIGFLFHTFFSMDISSWEIFAPIKWIFLPEKIMGYDGTMTLSIIVGVLHICLAMCVKTYQETKNKGLSASLGTWGWTLLIVGGIIVGGLTFIGVISSEITKWIVIVLGIVSALGIFVFNDPHRNKFANVGVGLWDTYNTVTGLLSDVLSYLRLYALGLAGSMLGLAFNNIGTMILGDGSSIKNWIFFILIVIVGHTLNIAMAALGAFVHPLRLNFLEFFKNSGYEASGRNYNPLKNA